MADKTPAEESSVDKPDSNGSGPLAGVAGASETGREKVPVTSTWQNDPMRHYRRGGVL